MERGENTHSETPRPTDGGAEDVRDADRQRPRVEEKRIRQWRTARKLAVTPSHELSNRPADGPSSQETDRQTNRQTQYSKDGQKDRLKN